MQTIGQSSKLESLLYGEDDIYHWSETERLEFQFDVIRDAFKFHYDNCLAFRRFCSSEGISPDSIKSPEDIIKIPLIPSSMFKSLEIRSVPEERITKVCRSSGTRGNISRVPRDTSSLERFLGSIRISADQILGIRNEAQFFNFGPDTSEAGDVWFPYVMSLLGLLRPSDNYIINDVFYVKDLVEDLLRLPSTTQPFLIGPPIFVSYFMHYLEEEGVTLDLDSRYGFVVTGGGWKTFSNEQISREEFISRCGKYIGVNDCRHIRDAYNMVELNTVIFECELGVKHLPPWLVVEALDPENLTPRQSNEMGLLGFYDPLPTSYPGFILSDDFGRVNKRACDCGRSGPTMEFSRRVALVEGRGCALTMDRNVRVEKDIRVSGSAGLRASQ